MQIIKITDYNYIELLEVDYKNVFFRWINRGKGGRKYKARIRYNGENKPYFNSYNLSISLEGRI